MANGSFVQVSSGTGPKLATGPLYTENASSVQDEKVILGENYIASYILPAAAATGSSTATANSHLLQIMAGASLNVRIRRIEMYLMAVTSTANLMNTQLIRLTSAGTGGTGPLGPAALDPSDSVAGASGMVLPTTKGTEGIVILTGAPYIMQTIGASAQLNQPILVWDFMGPHSKPLIIAAGVANGICIKNVTAIAAATVGFNVWLDETAF